MAARRGWHCGRRRDSRLRGAADRRLESQGGDAAAGIGRPISPPVVTAANADAPTAAPAAGSTARPTGANGSYRAFLSAPRCRCGERDLAPCRRRRSHEVALEPALQGVGGRGTRAFLSRRRRGSGTCRYGKWRCALSSPDGRYAGREGRPPASRRPTHRPSGTAHDLRACCCRGADCCCPGRFGEEPAAFPRALENAFGEKRWRTRSRLHSSDRRSERWVGTAACCAAELRKRRCSACARSVCG